MTMDGKDGSEMREDEHMFNIIWRAALMLAAMLIVLGTTAVSAYASDLSLSAKWKPVTYGITYDLDGGTASNPSSYTIETPAFSLNAPTKTGCAFLGWSGTGLTGNANKTVTVAKGSMGARSYTAHWSEASVTFKFVGEPEGITKVTTYRADGTLGGTYPSPGTSASMTAYPGGKIVFEHDASKGNQWLYETSLNSYTTMGGGAKNEICHCTCPETASGTGILYVVQFDSGYRGQGFGTYNTSSTGWCRSIQQSTFALGS